MMSNLAGGPKSIRKITNMRGSPTKGQQDPLGGTQALGRKEDVEYPFVQWDEASLFAKDYLGIREDPRIVKTLKKFGEDLLDFRCYSDYMFRINHREHKEKRAILITSTIYIANKYNIDV
jgi:hypothetical protein